MPSMNGTTRMISTKRVMKLAAFLIVAKPVAVLTMLLLTGLIAGCAAGDKESILPQDGPTMKEVYRNHFSGTPLHQIENTENTANYQSQQGTLSASIKRPHRDPDGIAPDLSRYTRDARNEIRLIFPRLRNKTLILYVFPHLSKGERHPVPGYSTAFTLYEKTEYALPGELEEGY